MMMSKELKEAMSLLNNISKQLEGIRLELRTANEIRMKEKKDDGARSD